MSLKETVKMKDSFLIICVNKATKKREIRTNRKTLALYGQILKELWSNITRGKLNDKESSVSFNPE